MCKRAGASARWNTSYVKAKVKIENGVSHKAAKELPDMSTEELKKKFQDNRLTDRMPTEEDIREVLKSTGKYTPRMS